MEEHGLHQYEISNFAKLVSKVKHNLTYWNNDEYYGFGAGAHGYIDGIRYQIWTIKKVYGYQSHEGKLPILDEHDGNE